MLVYKYNHCFPTQVTTLLNDFFGKQNLNSCVKYDFDPIHLLGLEGERVIDEAHARTIAIDPKYRLFHYCHCQTNEYLPLTCARSLKHICHISPFHSTLLRISQ